MKEPDTKIAFCIVAFIENSRKFKLIYTNKNRSVFCRTWGVEGEIDYTGSRGFDGKANIIHNRLLQIGKMLL